MRSGSDPRPTHFQGIEEYRTIEGQKVEHNIVSIQYCENVNMTMLHKISRSTPQFYCNAFQYNCRLLYSYLVYIVYKLYDCILVHTRYIRPIVNGQQAINNYTYKARIQFRFRDDIVITHNIYTHSIL